MYDEIITQRDIIEKSCNDLIKAFNKKYDNKVILLIESVKENNQEILKLLVLPL